MLFIGQAAIQELSAAHMQRISGSTEHKLVYMQIIFVIKSVSNKLDYNIELNKVSPATLLLVLLQLLLTHHLKLTLITFNLVTETTSN